MLGTDAPSVYSFRDPNSHVELRGEHAVRVIEPSAAVDMSAFLESPLFADLVKDGAVAEPVRVEGDDDGRLVLHHELIPAWTYPYEWSWTMLRDAARLHLDILLRAADHGFTLSDATSFNVTFTGGRPVFIDFGSFVRRSESEPWWAYTQFCEHFLYPLMVSSYTGADLQKLLRGGFGRVSLDDAQREVLIKRLGSQFGDVRGAFGVMSSVECLAG